MKLVKLLLVLWLVAVCRSQVQFEELGPFIKGNVGHDLTGGGHVLYSVEKAAGTSQSPNEKKMFIVYDGKPGREYDFVWGLPTLSSDGSRFAYRADIGSRKIIVLDGRESVDYDETMDMAFSPDGKHFAYLAEARGESFAVVDGKEGRHFRARRLDYLKFSPDGGSIAFVVKLTDSTQFVFWKDKPGPEFEDVDGGSLAFSPDSKHLAYVAQKDGGRVVVMDGKSTGASPTSISLALGRFVYSDAPVWSPDSKHLAYAAKQGTSSSVVVDGKARTSYDEIPLLGDPVRFSPDGTRLVYPAKRRGKWIMVDNDQEVGPECDQILVQSITFSPDSKRLAFGIRRGDKWSVVADGKVGPSADEMAFYRMNFSPDSKHFAYAMQEGAKPKLAFCDSQMLKVCPIGPAPKFFVVLDDQPSAKLDDVKFLSFSPESRVLAYAAKTGESWQLVPGSAPDLQFQDILAVDFRSDGKLEFVAVKDGSLFRGRRAAENVPGPLR